MHLELPRSHRSTPPRRSLVRRFATFAAAAICVTAGALACVMPPAKPPRVVIERHSATDVWITICDYTSFGADSTKLCACAFKQVDPIKSITSITITDTSGQPIPGFSFGHNETTSQSIEALTTGNWEGFLSHINGVIPRNIPVKIMIEVTIDGDYSNEQLDSAMRAAGNIIATDEADQNGYMKGEAGHLHIVGEGSEIHVISGVEEERRFAALYGKVTAYPNPTRGPLAIEYHLPKSGAVRLAIYDVTGKPVATLVDERQSDGDHLARWNGLDASGRAVPAGSYLYSITIDGVSLTRGIQLVR